MTPSQPGSLLHDVAYGFFVLLLCSFVIAIVALNVWNWLRRRRMTKQERAEEYRDMHIPGDW